MTVIDTKAIYSEVYRAEGYDYGSAARKENLGVPGHVEVLKRWIKHFGLHDDARLLEVGCGLGHLHRYFPGWAGVEYSTTAVDLAKVRYPGLNIVEGDARDLPADDNSVDMYASFAALEHVPHIEKAFAEVERVVRPGGVALLNPAWNCRPWTVKKLKERPYGELSVSAKIGKFLIPLRNNLIFRMFCSIPSRAWREVRLLIGGTMDLDYRPLEPDFSLWERFGHDSDDDAFINIDAHAAIAYFVSRGWACISHPTLASRFSCRGEEVVLVKPV